MPPPGRYKLHEIESFRDEGRRGECCWVLQNEALEAMKRMTQDTFTGAGNGKPTSTRVFENVGGVVSERGTAFRANPSKLCDTVFRICCRLDVQALNMEHGLN